VRRERKKANNKKKPSILTGHDAKQRGLSVIFSSSAGVVNATLTERLAQAETHQA